MKTFIFVTKTFQIKPLFQNKMLDSPLLKKPASLLPTTSPQSFHEPTIPDTPYKFACQP